MIRNIIFDFGDIFINLDKEIVFREMKKYGDAKLTPELIQLNNAFEIGSIAQEEFLKSLQTSFPKATSKEIIAIWNSMILDFPDYRLNFIEDLAKQNNYRLFLLSNTNEWHIAQVKKNMGAPNYSHFKNCFEKFYLSHEINLRKPDTEIFEFVLKQNKLKASETFFVDDTKEHTDAARALGIKTWNLIVGKEDIIQLKSKL